MALRQPRVFLGSLLALFALLLLGAPNSQAAERFEVIAYAHARGVHKASSGFDTGVNRPARMFLRVRVEPNKSLRLEYQVACNNDKDDQVINRDRRTRSGRIDLPLLVTRPKGCVVYAFASYKNFRYEKPVKFRVSLLARQRANP